MGGGGGGRSTSSTETPETKVPRAAKEEPDSGHREVCGSIAASDLTPRVLPTILLIIIHQFAGRIYGVSQVAGSCRGQSRKSGAEKVGFGKRRDVSRSS